MAIPGLLYAIPVDIEIDCGTITIPALAGEPKRAASRDHRSRDYPRARGGTNLSGLPFSFGPGLSPRSRGNHLCDPEPGSSPGTIPALAGNQDVALEEGWTEVTIPALAGEPDTKPLMKW